MIGKGGMGAVYEAIQEPIERRVAIKILHGRYAQEPEIAQRFFNEARAVNMKRNSSRGWSIPTSSRSTTIGVSRAWPIWSWSFSRATRLGSG